MHERISKIKSSEEFGVKFMQEWEEKIIERQKAREEGLAEGKSVLLMEQIQKKLKKGYTPIQIADALEEELSVIEEMITRIK